MARRRISVRKIIQTLVTLVAVTGCALAMISADSQQARRRVKGVQLEVKSPAGVQFLTEDAVRKMIFTERHIKPSGLPVAGIDERAIEAILRANPWVKDAQVYIDAEHEMHVSLTQRVPVVRLFETNGNSYYLDAGLQAMPLSNDYTHYTPAVTGAPKLGTDSLSMAIKGEIVGLVQHIQHDTFWSAQISQIDMGSDGGFELIPVLGKQRIIIGDTSNLGGKLNNLFAFYRQVQNKVGWDRYNAIDLRFQGQVIASPALSWKAPVDRAFNNMNWLQAIMDNAPKQTQLGGDAAAWSDGDNAPKESGSVQASRPAATPTKQAIKPSQAKLPAKAPATVSKPKLIPQAANKSTKPKAPLKANSAKPAKPQQHLQNTSRHKQNTTPNAATNR